MKRAKEIKLRKLDRRYKEALATFEAFRRLGIPSDDIFFRVGNVIGYGPNTLYVEAQQGERTFVVTIDRFLTESPEEIVAMGRAAGEAWNAAAEHETQTIIRNSKIFRQGVQLVLAMVEKGFVLSQDRLN